MKRTLIGAAVCASLLSGCASMLAPDYHRPKAPVPAAWPTGSAYGKPVEASQQAELPAWRRFILDDRLRQVVNIALENNRDLRIAALNIEQARAQYGIARSALLPSVNLSAAGNHAETPRDLTTPTGPRISHSYTAGVGFSAYELDLFGKVQNQKDAAYERYLQTAEARNVAQISLVAEVAASWLTLAADQERLKLAQDTLQSQQDSYRLTQHRVALGIGSQLDLSQAETTVDSARLDVASLTSQVARDQNALRLLAGTSLPDSLMPPVSGLFDGPPVLQALPVGLSSDVLLNRPDLRADEHALKAANADIGAARAAFFPSITLTASAGSGSHDMARLFKGANGAWSFIPQLTLPIFNMGALSDQLDIAHVQHDINVARYEKDIQTAFRETADALADRGTLEDQLQAQQALTRATQQSYRLSQARYDNGIDGYLTLLDSQRAYYAAQKALIGTKLAEQNNRVTLFKVLGGGAL